MKKLLLILVIVLLLFSCAPGKTGVVMPASLALQEFHERMEKGIEK